MPVFSTKRNIYLLSIAECCAATGKGEDTIRRALKRPGVYVEEITVAREGKRGASKAKFIDPFTLGLPILKDLTTPHAEVKPYNSALQLRTESTPPQEVLEPSETVDISKDSESPAVFASATEMRSRKATDELSMQTVVRFSTERARNQLQKILPILQQPEYKRSGLIKALAVAENVHPRTVYRWIENYTASGLAALGKKRGIEKGTRRLPLEVIEAVKFCIMSNTPTTSTKFLHRTLLRAVPELMTYKTSAGHVKTVSVETVRAIRAELEQDPVLSTAFFNADNRKEWLRTYSGTVMSAHANDIWEIDMTRCDTFVYDTAENRSGRLRIHLSIDVFSGVFPGLVFSWEENQRQTDLLLLRSICKKGTAITGEDYPIWGVPKRIYWDNGKTYVSHKAEEICARLGIVSIHSKPRVSHSRGKIERAFGSIHNFERTLPGYAGENAVNRSSMELKRLEENTRKWLETGRDPGWGNRLLTVEEYQSAVLRYIVSEYHRWETFDGKTRLQHYLETVPRESQMIFDPYELFLLFADRETRKVTPGGTIRMENKHWVIPDGTLGIYVGRDVVVLRDQFALDGNEILIAYEDRRAGNTKILGAAKPAPEIAASAEASDYRKATRERKKEAAEEGKQFKQDYFNPNLIVANALQPSRELPAEVVIEPLPAPKARLAAFKSEPTDLDFLSGDDLPDDPDALLDFLGGKK